MFNNREAMYFRYMISSISIFIPNEDTISVNNGSINGIMIEKDFENDKFPILYVSIQLSQVDMWKILNNKTTVRFSIRMDKYQYKNNSDDVPVYRDVCFQDMFSMYIDDNSARLNEDLYNFTKDIQGGNTTPSDVKQSYDFFLFKESDLISGKTIINTVIEEGTMTDILTYLLSASGSKKVLMSPLDNYNTYNEVMLYPISVIENISELDNSYGLYKYGTTLFYDLDRTYLISKQGGADAYERNEYVNVFIYCYNESNASSLSGGCYKDNGSKTYSINVIKSTLNIKTTSIITNQISGIETVIVDSLTDTVSTISPNVQFRGEKNINIMDRNDVSYYRNQYIQSSMEARIIEQDSIIEIGFDSIDMSMLTPNKRFTFAFEDSRAQKDIGGVYRLLRCKYEFVRHAEAFDIKSIATFVKALS